MALVRNRNGTVSRTRLPDATRKALGLTPIREHDIEDYLVKRVKASGGEVRKVEWIGRKSAPDRVVMLPSFVGGNTIWVELKRPGKGATPAQAREHARMRAVGQQVWVINSFAGADWLLS